jgi:hypothetical protein
LGGIALIAGRQGGGDNGVGRRIDHQMEPFTASVCNTLKRAVNSI